MSNQTLHLRSKVSASSALTPADDHALVVANFTPLRTRTGFVFKVRRVEPFDKAALKEFFSHVTAEDMRFRFLSAAPRPGDDALDRMIDVDHDRKENYLAFLEDGRTLIASAVVAADETRQRAEVAIAMDKAYKGRGVGWTFLDYVARQERAKGVAKLFSIESRANHAVFELERDMGFSGSSYPGDASLVMLELDLTKANGV